MVFSLDGLFFAAFSPFSLPLPSKIRTRPLLLHGSSSPPLRSHHILEFFWSIGGEGIEKEGEGGRQVRMI